MADGNRMIAIAIGVAGSVPPKYLAGAIRGARDFAAWASVQGYETVLVVDEESPVTMPVLRKQIEDVLKASSDPIYRIIVYFAGHGLIRELEEGLWLLSDWRAELRAVAVEVLKRRLSMYGPRQVCIISDACRTLPADVEQAELVPDPVLGAGPNRVKMDVAIDKFVAVQDGAETFMIPGEAPEDDRCLFSGVLVEGLWGQTGLNATPFSKLEPDKVTSRSLGAYLTAEVKDRANVYGRTLAPTISPTFPELDDYYFTRNGAIKPPAFPPWPPKEKLMGQGSAQEAIDARLTPRFVPNIGLNFFDGPDADRQEELPPPSLLERLRDQIVPGPVQGVRSGLAVSVTEAAHLWLGAGLVVESAGSAGSWSIRSEGTPDLTGPAPVLVEFSDGLFAAAVVLPNLFASLIRDDHGVTGIVYRDPHGPRAVSAPTEEALGVLEGGTLRADAVTDLATQLRKWKHTDPVLGVISAYLYEAIGDIDSICRTASFYAENNEPIPYDIALLGGLLGHRTERGFMVNVPEVKARDPRTDAESMQPWTHCAMPARNGLVGGLWPWMRQGWVFLDDPGDVGSPLIMPELLELRAGLTRGRFATLTKDAALRLAGLCGLRRQ